MVVVVGATVVVVAGACVVVVVERVVVVVAVAVVVVVGPVVVVVDEEAPNVVEVVSDESEISPRRPAPIESYASDVSLPKTATPPSATTAISTTTIAYSTREAPRSDVECFMNFAHRSGVPTLLAGHRRVVGPG